MTMKRRGWLVGQGTVRAVSLEKRTRRGAVGSFYEPRLSAAIIPLHSQPPPLLLEKSSRVQNAFAVSLESGKNSTGGVSGTTCLRGKKSLEINPNICKNTFKFLKCNF